MQIAAANAAGTMRIESTVETLRSLTNSDEAALRDACFYALAKFGDAGAVDQAVADSSRTASPAAALAYLAAVGQRDSAAAVTDVALRNPASDILNTAIASLSRWAEVDDVASDVRRDLAARIARIQGHHGYLAHWRADGPLSAEDAARALSVPAAGSDPSDEASAAGRLLPISGQVLLQAGEGVAERHWVARTQVFVDQPAAVEVQLTSRDAIDIWINGERRHQQAARDAASVSTFDGKLPVGMSNIVVALAAAEPAAQFSLSFRHRADSAELERLAQAAMRQPGDAENGRRLFFDVAKTQCIKCHRIGERGERIGPDLTGIGGRFWRTHILESILQPSRSIANGYQTLAVERADGTAVSGIVVAQDDESLTLADNKGDKHRVLRARHRGAGRAAAEHDADRAREAAERAGVCGSGVVSGRGGEPLGILRRKAFVQHQSRYTRRSHPVGRPEAPTCSRSQFAERDGFMQRETHHDPRRPHDVLLVAGRGAAGVPPRQAGLPGHRRRRRLADLRPARGRHGLPSGRSRRRRRRPARTTSPSTATTSSRPSPS